MTRNCIRAIARYSVVKELNRAVVAAGPHQSGASKILKRENRVNHKSRLCSSPRASPSNDRNRCRARSNPCGPRAPSTGNGDGSYAPGPRESKEKNEKFLFFSRCLKRMNGNGLHRGRASRGGPCPTGHRPGVSRVTRFRSLPGPLERQIAASRGLVRRAPPFPQGPDLAYFPRKGNPRRVPGLDNSASCP